jgi:hypothetical protein
LLYQWGLWITEWGLRDSWGHGHRAHVFQRQCWLSELRVSWCSARARKCSQQFTVSKSWCSCWTSSLGSSNAKQPSSDSANPTHI